MRVLRHLIAAPLAVALTAGAAVALASCSASGTGSGSSGGVLHIGTTYPIDSMNPFVAQSDYSYAVYEYIYPQLVQYDAKLGIAPDFARSWSTSDGGRTWTFHTVPHARWSDGKPLTAADVAWTINEVMKYKNGPAGQWAGLLEHMIGASAPNATTLVIKYSTAVANVLEQMQGMSVLPKQVWAPYFTGNGAKLKTFANVPPANGKPMVSGGPFELVQYKSNQYALFKRNPNWWGPKPKIEGFGLQFFSNADAMVQALKNGQVDFIGEYTPPTAVKALKQAGFAVTTTPSISMKTFIINTNPHKTTHRELLNPRVRRGDRVRHRPQPDHQDRVARPGAARQHDHRASRRFLARPERQGAAVRHREGQPAARRGRLQARAERGQDRRRTPDVLQRDLPAGRARHR